MLAELREVNKRHPPPAPGVRFTLIWLLNGTLCEPRERPATVKRDLILVEYFKKKTLFVSNKLASCLGIGLQ